jgi:uncharacterized membrane protein YcgQ (UPF0703/DUF1980 family)
MKTEEITQKIDELQAQMNQRAQQLINSDTVCVTLSDHIKTLNVMLSPVERDDKEPEVREA